MGMPAINHIVIVAGCKDFPDKSLMGKSDNKAVDIDLADNSMKSNKCAFRASFVQPSFTS
jgi:hypothetical protein